MASRRLPLRRARKKQALLAGRRVVEAIASGEESTNESGYRLSINRN